MSFCEAFSLKAARERVFYHTGRVKSRLKWYEIVTSEPIFVLSRQLKGSSPVSSYLFVFLYRCKETQKVHQHFQAFLRAKSKKSGSEEVDQPLRSPVLLGFALFLPKMQEKTSFAVVDKRRFFYGGEQGIRTLETALTVYTISSRAPSTSSDNSPRRLSIIHKRDRKIKCFLKFFLFSFIFFCGAVAAG